MIKNIYGLDIIKVKNGIWFSAADRNGLFEYDLIDKKVIFRGIFPKEELWGRDLHSCVLEWQDRLIFIPARARNISIYDLRTGAFDTCSLPQELDRVGYKFIKSVIWNGKLFLIGDQIPKIFIFDMSTRQCRQLDPFKPKENASRSYMPYFSKDLVIKDGSMFLITRHSGVQYKLDMDTEEIEEQWISGKDGGNAMLCHDGKNLWSFENYRSELICWNEKGEVLDKAAIPRDLFEKGGYWIESIFGGGKVILFQTHNIVFYDPQHKAITDIQKSGSSRIFEGEQQDFDALHEKNMPKMITKHLLGDQLCFLTDQGIIYRLDQDQGITEICSLVSEDQRTEEKMRWSAQIKAQQIGVERDRDSLEIFMECVSTGNVSVKEGTSDRGKNIYREMMSIQ